MKLSDIMMATATQLQADFEGVTRRLGASVDIGAAREDAVRQFIALYLAPHLAAESGELTDCHGQLTGQLDLVVFDRAVAPPLFSSPSVKVVPCEAVRAVVEVKSNLSVTGFVEDAEKIRRAKSLQRQLPDPPIHYVLPGFEREEWPPLLGGIFAFGSSATLTRIGTEMQAWNTSVPKHERTDFVTIMDQGIVACGRDDPNYNGLLYPDAERDLTMFEQKLGPGRVLLFLTGYVHFRVDEFDAFAGRLPSLVFRKYLAAASEEAR